MDEGAKPGGPALSPAELARYQRQMMLPGWGPETQGVLKQASVFLAGAGGLASSAAIYLAVAGLGRLVLCDDDQVEASNLNRQILHDPGRIGVAKVDSARATLARLNPELEVVALRARIGGDNVDALVGQAQVIVDCLDNFQTRYLLNDTAMRKGIPLVHGSVYGLEGRLSFIHVPHTACLRCIFPAAPPPATFPVLGATPGVIGAMQALEVIKYLARVGSNLSGKLLAWDGGSLSFQLLRTVRDPRCPSCGQRSTT